MKKLLFLLFIPFLSSSQHVNSSESLFAQYENYKETSLTKKAFKHSDITPLIEKLKSEDVFRIKELGTSIQNRSISMISIGSGKTSVLLWSQMHGNESTATMAIFDILNYLKQHVEILKNLTLHYKNQVFFTLLLTF